MAKGTGAHYEISIDGVPRTHHDVKETAIGIGQNLKLRNPSAVVKVTDLRDGTMIVIAAKA